MKKTILAAIALLLVASALPVPAAEVTVKGAEKLTISAYTQARYAYRTDIPDSLVNNALFVNRARVKLAADITKHTWAELQVDFASSRRVKDAIVGLEPHPAITIQAGQFKRPYSQEELFSSSATPLINRGLMNDLAVASLGYGGRSQGLMGIGRTRSESVTGYIGVFTGAGEADLGIGDNLGGRQTDFNNRGKDIVGRLVYQTKGEAKLRLAASGSTRSVGGNYTGGDSVTHKAKVFTSWGADGELKLKELSLWAEVDGGDNFRYSGQAFTDTLMSYKAPSFIGWHIAANWYKELAGDHMLSAIQPEARFEMLDPNTDVSNDGSNLVTAGLSLFFGKGMRWRTNAEWEMFQDDTETTTRIVSELQAKF